MTLIIKQHNNIFCKFREVRLSPAAVDVRKNNIIIMSIYIYMCFGLEDGDGAIETVCW